MLFKEKLYIAFCNPVWIAFFACLAEEKLVVIEL